MSGLAVIGTLIPFLIAFLIGYSLGRDRSRMKLFWWLFALAFGALLLTAMIMSAREGLDANRVIVAFAGVALAGLAAPPILQLRRRRARLGPPVFAVLAAALVTGVLVGIDGVVDIRARKGYAEDPLHLVQATTSGCVGHLLWAGERAMVLDCDDDLTDHKDVVVIYGHENREFRRHTTATPKPNTRQAH